MPIFSRKSFFSGQKMKNGVFSGSKIGRIDFALRRLGSPSKTTQVKLSKSKNAYFSRKSLFPGQKNEKSRFSGSKIKISKKSMCFSGRAQNFREVKWPSNFSKMCFSGSKTSFKISDSKSLNCLFRCQNFYRQAKKNGQKAFRELGKNMCSKEKVGQKNLQWVTSWKDY